MKKNRSSRTHKLAAGVLVALLLAGSAGARVFAGEIPAEEGLSAEGLSVEETVVAEGISELVVDEAPVDSAVPEGASFPMSRALHPLEPNSVAVDSYAALKTALETNNGYTTFYLTADITMASGGILVHSSKPFVIIDGMMPGGDGTRHKLTEFAGSAISNTIQINHPHYRLHCEMS